MSVSPADGPVEERARQFQAALLERPWWELVLRGIIILVFGMLALVYPGLTIAVFVIFFGAFTFIEGIFGMVGALGAKADNPQWILMFISSMFSFAVGVIVLSWPGMSALVLLYFIGAWFLINGTVQIVFGLRSKEGGARMGTYAIGGILGIVIGLMAFTWPGATAIGIAWIIGIFAIIFGVQLIVLGLMTKGVEGTSSAAMVA